MRKDRRIGLVKQPIMQMCPSRGREGRDGMWSGNTTRRRWTSSGSTDQPCRPLRVGPARDQSSTSQRRRQCPRRGIAGQPWTSILPGSKAGRRARETAFLPPGTLNRAVAAGMTGQRRIARPALRGPRPSPGLRPIHARTTCRRVQSRTPLRRRSSRTVRRSSGRAAGPGGRWCCGRPCGKMYRVLIANAIVDSFS